MRVLAAALLACVVLPCAGTMSAQAQGKPIRIALIEDKTGPLEAYAKQSITGFMLGLEYATHGTNAVAGRKMEIIEKDSQAKPEMGRSLLGEAYSATTMSISRWAEQVRRWRWRCCRSRRRTRRC